MSRPTDELFESDYDGIQEYDNDLPNWWRWLFYITILFAGIYSSYMHFVNGKSDQEAFAQKVAAQQEQAKNAQKAGPAEGDSEEALLKLVSDTAVVTSGKAVFTAKCVACHGPDGQGLIGPNLTDDNWIHGGKITDIKNTVDNGVLDKGMLAWKAQLPAEDIRAVVAYVYSIHGTNPANPKAPQGELYQR